MSDLFSLFDQIVDTPKIVKPIIKPKIDIVIQKISNKSIRIGNYIFNICYSFDYIHVSYGRNTIFLESILNSNPRIIKKFIVYQSLSEIGLWRLLCFINTRGQLGIYKGTIDYIQQTMINIHLQNHLDYYFTNSVKNNSVEFNKYFNDFDSFHEEVVSHIDDKKRSISIDPFNKYVNYECGDLNKLENIKEIEKLSIEIQSSYNYTQPILINSIDKTIDLDKDTQAKIKGDIFSTNLIPKSDTTLSQKLILYYIKYN